MAENCPAVKVGEEAPCRWVPVTVANDTRLEVPSDRPSAQFPWSIQVLEVCQGCRSYKVTEYHLVPRDSNGVQSTS